MYNELLEQAITILNVQLSVYTQISLTNRHISLTNGTYTSLGPVLGHEGGSNPKPSDYKASICTTRSSVSLYVYIDIVYI